MSKTSDVCNLKLCLEILTHLQINAEVTQVQKFLADDKQLEFVNDWVEEFKQRWENFSQPVALPTLTELENLEPVTDTESNTVLQRLQDNYSKPPVRFKLANAMVGKTYQARLEWTSDNVISVLDVAGLDNLGLIYEPAQNLLVGEPQVAGEHPIIIAYQYDNDPIHAIQTTQLNLVINSDPKSLWKNIHSNPDEPFWKKDRDFQGYLGNNGWRLLGASRRGRSHAHTGSCRDDDFALEVDDEQRWHLIAVADGAGSSQYAREGSKLIAHTSVNALSKQLAQKNKLLTELIQRWQKSKKAADEAILKESLAGIFFNTLTACVTEIEELAALQHAEYKDFYSTLLLAVHKSCPDGEFVAAYWIGDGGMGLYHYEYKIDVLGKVDSGEYAGQTRFLDRQALDKQDILNRLQLRSPETFTALILMTDGVSDPIFETDNNLQQVARWDKFWQQLEPLLVQNPKASSEKICDWLDFWSQGNHDDRTIALLYR